MELFVVMAPGPIDMPDMATMTSPEAAVAACCGVSIVCTGSMSSSTLYDAVD